MNHREPVLLADDDNDFAFLLQTALESAGVLESVEVVGDGPGVLQRLKEESGPFATEARVPPKLVLLDLKLPGLNGLEVLRWIRAQPRLQQMPVVVLTGSLAERDLQLAKQLGADSFFLKPFHYQALLELARTLRDTWLQTAVQRLAA